MLIKKQISREVKSNIEITRKEIKTLSEKEELKIMDFVDGVVSNDDDPESLYQWGIGQDFNGDVIWINFNWLIEHIEDRQTDLEEWNEQDDFEHQENEQILKIIKKYDGWMY